MCIGHGTAVASVAGGRTKGSAKGAALKIVKTTVGCSNSTSSDILIAAFDWLAVNAPRGTIINLSFGLDVGLNNCPVGGMTHIGLENAIKKAADSGKIITVAAGNDNCNTANYTPTRQSDVFVVGATDNRGLSFGPNTKASFSKTGSNVSMFVPGYQVAVLTKEGGIGVDSGTSLSAPHVAGLFAVVCQTVGTYCDSASTQEMYQAFRKTSTIGTVASNNGSNRGNNGAAITRGSSRLITQR